MRTFVLGLVSSIVALAAAGCSGKSLCERRPWDCQSDTGTGGGNGSSGAPSTNAGAGNSSGAPGSGSCDTYVPPSYQSLAANPKLPDPFASPNGVRITTSAEWPCRRAEIKAQAQTYELGPNPGAPESVQGTLDGNAIKVAIANGGLSTSFSATITYPTTGTAPYPAMIGIGGISIGAKTLNDMGVATIIFPNDVLAKQMDGSSRGKGAFYDVNPGSTKTGAMMAWAWGVSRLIDALEQLPDAQIDPTRLGVTGCSRNGKGALIVGAFEDRIVLTIPQESGSGGAASWRVSDAMVVAGTQVQTLSEITGENVWFSPDFSRFNNTANRLPFDHHMIEGLVAPRALLVIENTSQVWLGNLSTYANSMAAHKIWQALGIPEKMGFSQKGDHQHCEWKGSQQAEVTAYVQNFLIGPPAGDTTLDTNVLKTDGVYNGYDEATWVDWTTPTL